MPAEKTKKQILSDKWRRRDEEDGFLRYLGPYYSRAAKDNRQEEFLEQAFHLWLDRFPIVHAPDTEADKVTWVREAEKKRFREKMRWVGAVYSKRPSPTQWDTEITVIADRARRCKEFLDADRLGIKLQGHQYKVAAAEADIRNRTFEEIERDWLEEFERDSFLERTLYWLEQRRIDFGLE